MERPAEEREFLEAQWLCEHYQRHCSVKFPCCMQFYSCHHCHNISTACDNEEAKACHATHLKCSYCQHEQEICEGGARCQKCSREMSAFFCSICKHFTSLDENPYHCEECGICWIHKDKSFHRDVCNVCLDKQLGGNHKCRPDSSRDEFCICLEDAFIGCQILPCSHKGHRGSTNVAVTQNGIEEEDKGVSTENQYCTLHSLSSDEGCVDPRNHLEDLLDNPHLQTISLDGSSLVEKKSIPVDLENPAEALFLTDKEKRFMQCYDAHLQGNELGNTMSDGVLAGASSPSTSFFEPHLGDFERSRVSLLHNSDHKSSDNSLLALERCVAEASAVIKRVLQEREEDEQFGRGIEAEQNS
ncbi:unnamed protein product [Porites lobata]|uniref:Uncharacterized protein n=1 Tax=Porites lobata TaxID=104759 RepID=A0ABN8NGM1_9CNID|nr:unnamed protein product [Porites lobata]